MSDHLPELDSDTVSTWHVYRTVDGWLASPCDPVPDHELDVLSDTEDRVVLTDGYVVAQTRNNAVTRAAMLAKRQGVGR